MRSVTWAPKARTDFRSLVDYIRTEDRRAAALVSHRIREAVRFLRLRPIGRPGRVDGTYEKPVAKTFHIIVYRLKTTERLEIVRIIHMARDWPPGRWPRENREDKDAEASD